VYPDGKCYDMISQLFPVYSVKQHIILHVTLHYNNVS